MAQRQTDQMAAQAVRQIQSERLDGFADIVVLCV